MKCLHCQKEVNESFAFCPHCGKEIPTKVEEESIEAGAHEAIEDAKLVVPEKENATAAVNESLPNDEKKTEKHQTNFKALGLLVAFVFSILAVVFAFQINNKLTYVDDELSRLNERLSYNEWISLNKAKETVKSSEFASDSTEVATPKEVGVTGGEVVIEFVHAGQDNGNTKAVIYASVSADIKYNGVSFDALNSEEAVTFAQETIDHVWTSSISEQPFETFSPLSIELFVNEQLFATHDGTKVTLN